MDARSALEANWAVAAACKDHPGLEDRQQRLSSLLSQLTACFPEPWFQPCVLELLQATYPKQFRCLLDAALQRFIALSPLHCGCILQGFLTLPNSKTVSAPFRRDLATLFKAPERLSPTCWPQQGTVVCSIVAYLATAAAQHLAALPSGLLRTATPSTKDPLQAQHFGTAISWLTDCILQAVPQQQLPLLQLVLAVSVAEFTKLGQQRGAADVQKQDSADAGAPPAKKQRLDAVILQQESANPQQLVLQHAGGPHAPAPSSSGSSNQPNSSALISGIQILTAVCCCERMQHCTKQLLPAAAAAAVLAVAANCSKSSQLIALQEGSYLYRHLAAQLTAATHQFGAVVSATAATTAQQQFAASASPATASAALQPADAVRDVLQHLAAIDPAHVVSLVRILVGVPVDAAAALPTNPAAAEHAYQQLNQQQWLLEAAQQWQPSVPASQAASALTKKGKVAKHQQQAAKAATAGTGQPSNAAEVLSDAGSVSSTWVCKHLVPILCQHAAESREEQHKQQMEGHLRQEAMPPALAAQVQLLAAGHLLLPAAGEVLVSARFLAEALNALNPQLQGVIAQAWQLQLLQPQQRVAEAQVAFNTAGASTSCGTSWKLLQPMLCLLSHLDSSSPFASVLAAAVQHLVAQSAQLPASTATARDQGFSKGVREVMRHILLPVRFPISSPGRLLLLRHLLHLHSQQQAELWQEDLLCISTAKVVLGVVLHVLREETQQLALGLQLLAADTLNSSERFAAAGLTGTELIQQHTAKELAAVVTGLLQATNEPAGGQGPGSPEAGQDMLQSWRGTVRSQLIEALSAADRNSYLALHTSAL